MSKFKVGDEVECRYEIHGEDCLYVGIVTNTDVPFRTEYRYTVQEKDGRWYRYKESELTLINEDLENV